MDLIEYHHKLHHYHLNECLALRGHPGVSQDETPRIGYVAYSNKDQLPIAYGFLRLVEGNMAMIDGLATDPRVESGPVRLEALNMVFKALLDRAQVLNITQLIGFSLNDTTMTLSEQHGFVKLPHTLMAHNGKV